MSRNDEYWRRAMEATNYARSATSEFARGAWLRIAKGFLALARKRPESRDVTVETDEIRPKQRSRSLH